MSAITQPSIIDSAVKAWNDALAARSRMPTLFWTAIGVLIVLQIVLTGLIYVSGGGVISALFGLIRVVANALFLTPIAIAIHRFVLLGEAVDTYRFDPQQPRFQKFFLFAAAIAIVGLIPRAVGAVFVPILGGVGSILVFVLVIVAAIIWVRNVMLFPAIAVDASGADWPNAMADTKGHSWRVFLILLCTILPPAIVAGVLMIIFAFIPLIGIIVVILIQAAFTVFMIAATAAAASHLYAAYANQLGRPAVAGLTGFQS